MQLYLLPMTIFYMIMIAVLMTCNMCLLCTVNNRDMLVEKIIYRNVRAYRTHNMNDIIHMHHEYTYHIQNSYLENLQYSRECQCLFRIVDSVIIFVDVDRVLIFIIDTLLINNFLQETNHYKLPTPLCSP